MVPFGGRCQWWLKGDSPHFVYEQKGKRKEKQRLWTGVNLIRTHTHTNIATLRWFMVAEKQRWQPRPPVKVVVMVFFSIIKKKNRKKKKIKVGLMIPLNIDATTTTPPITSSLSDSSPSDNDLWRCTTLPTFFIWHRKKEQCGVWCLGFNEGDLRMHVGVFGPKNQAQTEKSWWCGFIEHFHFLTHIFL